MRAVAIDNSTAHQIGVWFTTGSSWTGSGGALPLLGQHIWISLLSLALACLISIPLAIGLARLSRGGFIVTSLANAARAIPIVGVLILLAVGPLGVGDKAAIVALVIFAIPPVLTNTYTGIRGVDSDIVRAAVGMGMARSQVTRKVELPLAIPLIAAGVRLAAVQIWATATIAAIVGAGGLGQLVTTGYAISDYGEVYGGVVVVVVTALLLDASLSWLQTLLRRRFAGAQPSRRARRRALSRAAVTGT